MARINTIQKAKQSKKDRRCKGCGHIVQPGESYKYIDKRTSYPRFGSVRLIFCQSCHPRPSDTLSGRAAEVAKMEEDFSGSVQSATTTDDLRSALEDLKSEIESMKETFEESAENIESGFGHATERSDRMGEIAGELDEFASNLDTVISDLEDYEDDEEVEELDDDAEIEIDTNLPEEPIEEKESWEDFFEAQKATAEEAASEMPDVSL